MLDLNPNFGECPCGGTFNTRNVEVRMNASGKTILLAGVPQGACPRCGSRVYRPADLFRLESITHGRKLERG